MMQSELKNNSEDHLIASLSRQSRLAAVWSSVGVLAVLISLVWSYVTIRSASRQLDVITRQRDDIAKDLTEKTKARDELNAQIDRLRGERDQQLALTNGVLQQVGANATQALNAVVEANPQIAKSIPRVFVQIGREDQRPGAKRVSESLRSAGFTVPGIEFVRTVQFPRKVTEVKFFYPLQDSSADLDKLLAALKSAGVHAEKHFTGTRAGAKLPPPRQYEIWFSLNEFEAQPTAESR
jgi:hypothetical protein